LESHKYQCFRYSNFKEGRQVIPGVAGREYEESIRINMVLKSNEYKIRILGQKAGVYIRYLLGQVACQAEADGRVGDVVYDVAAPVYTFSDIGDMYSA